MLRKLLLTLVILIAAVALLSGLVWWRAGATPGWYGSSEPVVDREEPSGPGSTAELTGETGRSLRFTSQDELLEQLARRGRMELGPDDLLGVVTMMVNDSHDARVIFRGFRSVRARIGDGEIEVGGMLDLSRVDVDELSPDTRDAVTTIRDWLPALTTSDRYVGVRTTPTAAGGDLAFTDDTSLRVGDTGIPLALIPVEGLRDDLVLPLPGLTVTHAEVVGDRLILETRPRR